MKLSIVIPCYNCEKTIGRLLQSIVDNNFKKEDYEVIVCDDKSTDNFLDIVKTFEDKMNIVYCTTTREVHCPGNTRQAALPYVHGEWLTFIDNDDMFEPNAFELAFKAIEEYNVEYTLCTEFREFFYEENKYGREFKGDQTDTWLHGKYFNVQKTLNEFHCYFKDDLMSHEDVFFNSCNLAQIISIGSDYVYVPVYTYKWVHNPESLSRSYFSKKDYYIDTYLGDFLMGACYPFFGMYTVNEDKNEELKNFALNQIMMTLLHGYFYYQASLWRLGANDTLVESYDALKSLKRKIVEELRLNDWDIIKYVYGMPDRYNRVKMGSQIGCCSFIETQSFRDFILNL